MTERAEYEMAFVVEQVLGHITHADNLRAHVAHDPEVRAHWVLPEFAVGRIAARLPVYRSNWTLRAGVDVRRQLGRLRSSTDLDVIFFHTQTMAMLCPDVVRRVPTVISIDATPRQYDELGQFYEHNVGPARLERFKTETTRRRFRSARRLVTWSEWARRGLIDDYGIPEGMIEVIPPGVTISDWATAPGTRQAAPDVVKLLFVGGDLERKGGLLLLEAFREVRELGAELHLVTRDEVAAEAGVHVHHGVLPNSEELRQLYRESDVFVLPTYGDCLPMVLSEAGASGMPTISTRVAAIPEIVLDGETGVLVPPGDRRALVDALRRMIASPGDRVRMGARAAKHVEHSYDTAANTARLLDVLKSAAGNRREPNMTSPT